MSKRTQRPSRKAKRHPGGVKTKNNRSRSNLRHIEARRAERERLAVLDPVVLEGKKVAELQELLRERNIPFNTKIRKPQLIEMLVGR